MKKNAERKRSAGSGPAGDTCRHSSSSPQRPDFYSSIPSGPLPGGTFASPGDGGGGGSPRGGGGAAVMQALQARAGSGQALGRVGSGPPLGRHDSSRDGWFAEVGIDRWCCSRLRWVCCVALS